MKISQREARRLLKRVAELEGLERSRANAWAREYPGGTNIAKVSWETQGPAITAVATARKLKHAVVAVNDGNDLLLYALPL